MGKIAENILSLSSEEAINYFINTEQYCTFDIPVYFDFTELLNYTKQVKKNFMTLHMV